jgi:GTP cyclohydrolase I
MSVIDISWDEAWAAAKACAARWADFPIEAVHGIPRGGVPPALMVAQTLGVPVVAPGTWAWQRASGSILVVDDLVDSGVTLSTWHEQRQSAGILDADALFRKPHSPSELAPCAIEIDGWLKFPWEPPGEDAPLDAVIRLLTYVGEDPYRDGLRDTPARYVKTFYEMTEGYRITAAEILARTFDEAHDEMIVLRQVPFTSLCEHHLLPFTGTTSVAYIPMPGSGVVGLSKLARLVELHARRLQIQERMTRGIAEDLLTHLNPLGVGVVVRAVHSCMALRGVRKSAEMITSSLHGVMRQDPRARGEFLDLTR